MVEFLKYNTFEKVMEAQEETGGGGGSGLLGTPTDGTYLDGQNPFTAGVTSIDDAVDALNETQKALIDNLLPSPGNLVGEDLVLAGTTLYTAKIPTGLSGAWVPAPGSTVTNLIVDGTYTLSTPDAASRFLAGLFADPASGGTVVHVLDASDADSRLVSAGVGSTGDLEITAIVLHNGIWRRVNARLNIALAAEGTVTHAIRHDTDSGVSNTTTLHFDDVNTAPSFSVAPSLSTIIDTTTPLSGVLYNTDGSVFQVDFTAASGIFEKAYHPTAVAVTAIPGATSVNSNPGATPAFGDTFVASPQLTLTAAQSIKAPPNASVTLQKPDGTNTVGMDPLPRGTAVSTPTSTSTTDSFDDEAERLVLGSGTAFSSAPALVDGNAQVCPGDLRHGADGDYGAHVLDAAYERRIDSGSPQSSGTVRFTGVTASQVAALGSGQLNVFIQLETDGVWFDLGLDVGLANGTGSGSTIADSIGGKILASGGDLDFSFAAPGFGGPFSTGNNFNRYRLRIEFIGANGLAITSVVGL